MRNMKLTDINVRLGWIENGKLWRYKKALNITNNVPTTEKVNLFNKIFCDLHRTYFVAEKFLENKLRRQEKLNGLVVKVETIDGSER